MVIYCTSLCLTYTENSLPPCTWIDCFLQTCYEKSKKTTVGTGIRKKKNRNNSKEDMYLLLTQEKNGSLSNNK